MLNAGHTVFIDEIQKIPELLNKVHRLIEEYDYNFILSGSSARKLKKSGTTINAWFQILADTHLGTYIFPFRPGFKVRETSHPKFTFLIAWSLGGVLDF